MTQTILVIDDDAAILDGIAKLLTSAGYTARCALSSAAAIEMLAALSPPDLIILDVILPGMDGFSLCRHIKQTCPAVPILMLSACDAMHDKVGGLEIGADVYFTKPFVPSELIAQVRALLRRTAHLVQSGDEIAKAICCGPICMWQVEHRVEVNGIPLSLSRKEWALLELFLQHPGRVFGREMLLREVWGTTYLGDSRTVDMHIQRLRAKLAEQQAAQHIETVRGFGYRFVENPSPP